MTQLVVGVQRSWGETRVSQSLFRRLSISFGTRPKPRQQKEAHSLNSVWRFKTVGHHLNTTDTLNAHRWRGTEWQSQCCLVVQSSRHLMIEHETYELYKLFMLCLQLFHKITKKKQFAFYLFGFCGHYVTQNLVTDILELSVKQMAPWYSSGCKSLLSLLKIP